MANLQSLLVQLGLDSDDFRNGLGRAGKSLQRFRDDVTATRAKVEAFGDTLAGVGKPAAFAAITHSATSMAAAVAPAAGALLLIPGAAAAGGAAMGTLNVAMTGFGEAMSAMGDPEKFAEAVGKLAPNAAATAQAVRDLVPAWDSLTRSVQDAAFAGVAEQVSKLGQTYIPVLEKGMTGVAEQFNAAAGEVGQFLANADTIADVEAILADTEAALGNLTGAVQPLLAAFRDIAAVGSSILPDLTSGATDAANRFADFIATARQTGKLEQWIRGGLDVLQQLGTIASNVGSALKGVFTAASGSSEGMLATLVKLTDQFATWANSAEGQKQLTATFNLLQQVMADLAVILPIVAGAFGALVKWVNSLPAPVQNVVTKFLAASLIIGLLTKKFAPLISVVGRLGGRLIRTATTTGTMTNRMFKALGRAGLATVKFVGKVALMAAKVGVKFALMAARAAVKAGIMAAKVGKKFAKMAVAAGVQMGKMSGKVIKYWGKMALRSLIAAGRMALAWIIAMGPIGWIIAAVIALVILIIANWDKVKKWTVKIWNAVVDWIKSAWDWIVDAVKAAGQWILDLVTNAWNSAKDAVVNAAKGIVDFVTGLPGMILDALGNLGSLLLDAGKAIIQGLIDGLMSAVGWLKDKLSWITGLIPDWKGPMRVDARLLKPTGQVIMSGLVDGIDMGADDVHKRLGQVTAAIAGTPTPEPRVSTGQQAEERRFAEAIERAVRSGMPDELVLDDQGGRVMARVVNRVNMVQNRR